MSEDLAKVIAAVLSFLAPIALWVYKEFRSNWRDRLKTDIEILKLCREAEASGANLSDIRPKIEHSIAVRAALFDEHQKYDWTYALLAVFAVVGAIASVTLDSSWLTRPIRVGAFVLMVFILVGAGLNFFKGEQEWRRR